MHRTNDTSFGEKVASLLGLERRHQILDPRVLQNQLGFGAQQPRVLFPELGGLPLGGGSNSARVLLATSLASCAPRFGASSTMMSISTMSALN